MRTTDWSRLPEILNAFEDLELPLLAWGVTEVVINHDEAMAVVSKAVDADFASGETDGPDELAYLDELLRRALLHRLPGSSPPQYRTRLAEGLRLLSSLRQMFPPGQSPGAGWWRRGAPLVSDYRLRVEPRRYPRRDVPLVDVRERLARVPHGSPMRTAILEALLDDRSLARFQLDAAAEILSALSEERSRGFVIGAGTGSGKTLAFYLPAFIALAPRLQSPATGTHTLALYPRKELLRDQAREAFISAQRLNAVLTKHGARPIRIGLLYADTPYDGRDQRLGGAKSAWRRRGLGVRCPYFSCPRDGCNGDLIWLDVDRFAAVERLVCIACKEQTPKDSVALTRSMLASQPADLLFTTTEMLNRHASNQKLGALLGWLGESSPELVLLDEVHTYTGVHGAQVALTLRRWRQSLRRRRARPPVFVGLSATLQDATAFFAGLTGLPESAVEYVTPMPSDMVPTGRQYSVILRGDPVSGASLLSTSLQVSMLMGRLLDPAGQEGLFGSSGFIFTDDLDVTNRFFDDLRDAEGGQTRARPGVARKPVLAQLRSPGFSTTGPSGATFEAERYRDGQLWRLVEDIGHPLSGNLQEGALAIGRTSSQDAGVDTGANLIVATSSLEVGFNDPRVGLVIQHKAPRDSSAFVQRKGRAGRSTSMRPWTVVVLSDYGRDRFVYQTYEQLLDPEITARRLPVRNRYVLKIQAVQACMDWMSLRSSDRWWVDARATLRAPKQPGEATPNSDRVAALVQRVLTEPAVQDDLARHLESALGVSSSDVQAVLWEEPRSLFLSALPTALRRLRTTWQSMELDPGFRPGEVLPEHVTRSLFEPLNVPDVVLDLPFSLSGEEVTTMPLMAALREAVPGRVSRRFGVDRDEHRSWLMPPQNGDTLELSQFISRGHRLGTWPSGGHEYEVVRPLAVRLAQPPAEIADSSNSTPTWMSDFVVSPSVAAAIPMPYLAPWKDLVAGMRFALHVTGDQLEVRRFAIGASGEIQRTDGTSTEFNITYSIDGTPAAMGFSLDVDALILDCMPLDRTDPVVQEHLSTPGWRAKAFAVRVAEDPALEGIANSFQRSWLSLLYLTAYSVSAATEPDPTSAIAGGRWLSDLPRTLGVLYRAEDPDDPTQAGDGRLVQRLQALSLNPTVIEVVERHAYILDATKTAASTWDLAERAYADTWGAAIRHAVVQMVPDAEDNDLIVDVAESDQGKPLRIIVSETSIGGLGLIEDLRLAYVREPQSFWAQVAAAVHPSDYEQLDLLVRRLLAETTDNPTGDCAQAVDTIRSARGAVAADAGLQQLLAAWGQLGSPPRHLAVAAYSSRFLRPGSDTKTDRMARDLLNAWDRLEDKIGAEVDARVIAYAAARGALEGVEAPSLSADQIYSLLWARGDAARNHHLDYWQPYQKGRILDRGLLAAAVDRRVTQIDVSNPDWLEQYLTTLVEDDAADLVAAADRRDLLAAAIRRIAAVPLDRGPIRVYGRLERLHGTSETIAARVSVAEAYQ
jgi:ATP-dependent Lhr-like helicase